VAFSSSVERKTIAMVVGWTSIVRVCLSSGNGDAIVLVPIYGGARKTRLGWRPYHLCALQTGDAIEDRPYARTGSGIYCRRASPLAHADAVKGAYKEHPLLLRMAACTGHIGSLTRRVLRTRKLSKRIVCLPGWSFCCFPTPAPKMLPAARSSLAVVSMQCRGDGAVPAAVEFLLGGLLSECLGFVVLISYAFSAW
jgi:hypothetical protein